MIATIKNIIVTTPKSEMQNSADEAKECIEQYGGYYFRKLGKNRPVGVAEKSKIYYVEDGYIRGFGVVASIAMSGYECNYTDRDWGDGWYAIIPACTWKWIRPIPMRGFQGFRYFDDSNVEIIGDWLDPKPEV